MNGPLRLTVLATGYAATLAEAARDAHVVLLLTDWAEFAELRPDDMGTLVAQRNIIDGRNVLDPAPWRAAGWNYRALGVALASPPSTPFAVRQSAKGGGQVASR
jgi:UDP-glucose/GDP-mannose dehydrogenase family, UDP binding domain